MFKISMKEKSKGCNINTLKQQQNTDSSKFADSNRQTTVSFTV